MAVDFFSCFIALLFLVDWLLRTFIINGRASAGIFSFFFFFAFAVPSQ